MDRTILVVDDEPGMREVIRDDLEAEGFHVLTAESGRSALEIYDQNANVIELIVSDVRMADGDGLFLAKELKIRFANPPYVILISGFSDVPRESFNSLGVADLIPKPYNIEALLSAVHRYAKNH